MNAYQLYRITADPTESRRPQIREFINKKGKRHVKPYNAERQLYHKKELKLKNAQKRYVKNHPKTDPIIHSNIIKTPEHRLSLKMFKPISNDVQSTKKIIQMDPEYAKQAHRDSVKFSTKRRFDDHIGLVTKKTDTILQRGTEYDETNTKTHKVRHSKRMMDHIIKGTDKHQVRRGKKAGLYAGKYNKSNISFIPPKNRKIQYDRSSTFNNLGMGIISETKSTPNQYKRGSTFDKLGMSIQERNTIKYDRSSTFGNLGMSIPERNKTIKYNRGSTFDKLGFGGTQYRSSGESQ